MLLDNKIKLKAMGLTNSVDPKPDNPKPDSNPKPDEPYPLLPVEPDEPWPRG